MTPFDPDALVAMLMSFYPAVSPAAFARARGERPEYFAGGTIFGSKGDKLRLPDGRAFDCIIAAGGPPSGRHWWCSLITDDAPGEPDPFALEDGALTPIDEEMPILPADPATFEALVSGELEQLAGTEDTLHRAGTDIVEFTGATALDEAYEREMVPAAEQHAAFVAAIVPDNPSDEIQTAEDHGTIIDGEDGKYDEDPPEEVQEPDPGDPPPDRTDPSNPPPTT